MSFEPDRYVGSPLQKLLGDLAHAKPEEVLSPSRGRVRTRGVRTRSATPPDPGSVPTHVEAKQDPTSARFSTLMPTRSETYLPPDHPQVEITGVVLETLLGRGGQGLVYAGRVVATGRIVAVKVLRFGYPAGPSRAAREAEICAKVSHRNILRVFQLVPAGDLWAVIMELVQGTELDSGGVAVGQDRPCFRQLADALCTLAEARIVHRDLKPANILLRQQDFSPVVIDFGVALDLTRDNPPPSEFAGTPFFLPPEAYSDGRPEPSWDAYSLGVTAAMVLGARFASYPTMVTLIAAKRSGEFDRLLERSLMQVPDAGMRQWILEMTSSDNSRRIAAVQAARRW